MFTPESEGQFSMNQLVVVELKVLATQYKIWVYLGCVFKTHVKRMYTQLGRKKSFEKRLREVSDDPHKWSRFDAICTTFQNCFQFGIRPEAVDDGQDHHTDLYNTKPLQKRDGG